MGAAGGAIRARHRRRVEIQTEAPYFGIWNLKRWSAPPLKVMPSETHLIAVFLENKPGQAALISEILAGAGINLYWLTTVNNGTFGVMKFLADKGDQAVQALKRQGLMVSLLPVLAVQTDNRPGALLRVTTSLRTQNINLDNCSGFVAGDHAILLVEVPNIDQARATLEGQGFRILSQEEVLRL